MIRSMEKVWRFVTLVRRISLCNVSRGDRGQEPGKIGRQEAGGKCKMLIFVIYYLSLRFGTKQKVLTHMNDMRATKYWKAKKGEEGKNKNPLSQATSSLLSCWHCLQFGFHPFMWNFILSYHLHWLVFEKNSLTLAVEWRLNRRRGPQINFTKKTPQGALCVVRVMTEKQFFLDILQLFIFFIGLNK